MEKILKICKTKTKIERKIHHVFVWNEKWSNLHMSVAYCEEVRFWETWHGRYTENRCICVYTQIEIHRERTNMSNLIPFFSEYRYLWSALAPISHLPWNARANAYRDHRVRNIWLFLTSYWPCKKKQNKFVILDCFYRFWTFGNKYSWMSTLSRNKQRKHTLSFQSQGESTSTDLPSPHFLRNRIMSSKYL